jgi:acetolactate synthase-1/2/3 large subunit
MKLSDYVIKFLNDNYDVDTIFTLSGGGCIHLIDSLGKSENVNYIATHHEQAAAIAAEGYARKKNKLGACLVTSGPGGTNALTGTLCSFLDSIPVIVISGQVNKSLTTNYTNLSLRQLGDQEFDIVKTAKTMTKYAVQVNDAEEIRYHLEKACYLATSKRPGPVWIDIPLDVQSAQIDPSRLKPFIPNIFDFAPKHHDYVSIVNKWNRAKKPLLIVGNGVRLSGAIESLFELLDKTNIPVITAVNGNDIVNESYPYYFGRFGTHAQICANKLINEADFIISIGSRLYVRQIGYNFDDFGKNAYKIAVDIDQNELDKPTLRLDEKVCEDAKKFINDLNKVFINKCSKDWLQYCESFRSPSVLDKHRNKTDYVSNYHLIEKLSEILPQKYDIVTSDGSANVVTMQVAKLKGDQRLITNTGCAPMGYGLPCAIGVASTGQKTLCIEGDGSLHLNIHELQTMMHNKLPIKLLLLNNDGYLSIKVTQKSFFNGYYVASEKSSGVTFPDFKKIADAYSIPYFEIKTNNEVSKVLENFLAFNGPCICQVFTDPDEIFEPKVVAKMDENGRFIPGCLSEAQWS